MVNNHRSYSKFYNCPIISKNKINKFLTISRKREFEPMFITQREEPFRVRLDTVEN